MLKWGRPLLIFVFVPSSLDGAAVATEVMQDEVDATIKPVHDMEVPEHSNMPTQEEVSWFARVLGYEDDTLDEEVRQWVAEQLVKDYPSAARRRVLSSQVH